MGALFISRAREGQRGTALSDLWEFNNAQCMSPLLLTYEQAASVLACSVRQVKRLVAAGELTSVRLGGAVRLRVEDLNSYVSKMSRGAEPATGEVE